MAERYGRARPPLSRGDGAPSRAMSITRQSLLLRAQAGDPGAWKDLVELYRPLIVAWLRYQSFPANEVDDLVQDVFVEVLRGLKRLREPAAFKGWLAQITVRTATRRLRQRNRAQSRSTPEWTRPLSG